MPAMLVIPGGREGTRRPRKRGSHSGIDLLMRQIRTACSDAPDPTITEFLEKGRLKAVEQLAACPIVVGCTNRDTMRDEVAPFQRLCRPRRGGQRIVGAPFDAVSRGLRSQGRPGESLLPRRRHLSSGLIIDPHPAQSSWWGLADESRSPTPEVPRMTQSRSGRGRLSMGRT